MYPSPPRKPVSTKGPKILTFCGVFVLLLGIVGMVFAITSMVSKLPTNVITSQGHGGSAAIAGLKASQEIEFSSPGGMVYDVWEVQSLDHEQFGLTRVNVTVTAPDGDEVIVTSPQVTGNTTIQNFKARTFASFPARQSGSYTIVITPGPGWKGPAETDASGAAPVDAVLTQGSEIGSFVTGIFTSIGGIFVGILGLLLGCGLTIGGAVWWAIMSGRRKTATRPEVSGA